MALSRGLNVTTRATSLVMQTENLSNLAHGVSRRDRLVRPGGSREPPGRLLRSSPSPGVRPGRPGARRGSARADDQGLWISARVRRNQRPGASEQVPKSIRNLSPKCCRNTCPSPEYASDCESQEVPIDLRALRSEIEPVIRCGSGILKVRRPRATLPARLRFSTRSPRAWLAIARVLSRTNCPCLKSYTNRKSNVVCRSVGDLALKKGALCYRQHMARFQTPVSNASARVAAQVWNVGANAWKCRILQHLRLQSRGP
jgi:hypothetical protein